MRSRLFDYGLSGDKVRAATARKGMWTRPFGRVHQTGRGGREIRTSPCICGVTPGSPLARIMRLGSKGLGGRGAVITQETFMIA